MKTNNSRFTCCYNCTCALQIDVKYFQQQYTTATFCCSLGSGFVVRQLDSYSRGPEFELSFRSFEKKNSLHVALVHSAV